MDDRNNMAGFERIVRREKPITKVGFDTGVLVALIDNNYEYNLRKPKFFMKKEICYAYQLVVNQTIGVLVNKRKYDKKRVVRETLEFLEKNNITIIREESIDVMKRNAIFEDLKNQRKIIKVIPKPEDSDLDILASYKSENIDCILTTNYKHFIELGKYLSIFIEGIGTKEQKERREINKMIRDFFWKPKKFR